MESVRFKSFACALLLAAVMVPASAQQNQKAVINNADIEAMKKANAFMPPPSVGFLNASKPGPSFDLLPGGSLPDYNNNPQQDEAWRKYQETQKDWTLMTPAEILGVPTPEKILGVADPDDEANLSPSERYLKRLDQQEQAGLPTNSNSMNPIQPAFQSGDGNPFEHEEVNIFRQSDTSNATNGPNAGNNLNRLWSAGIFQNPTLELEARRIAQGNPLWDSPFAQPPQELKPDQQEQDSMARFRTLLDPPAPPTPTLTQPTSTQPVDPNMQVLPAYNPDGNSFTPLQTLGARPTGLMPLPGLETRPLEPAPAKPAWTPKLPPWMTKETTPQNLANPQNFTQRVF